MNRKRLIVGISGASAPILGIRVLQLLQGLEEVETHLVYTTAVGTVLRLETEYRLEDVHAVADVVHTPKNMAAAISSGSFRTAGMLVAPCSINTMAAIAHSFTKDLLTRAADVTLKERRPLVLMVRESPFHLGHLRQMVQLTEMGAIIAPPIPAFYQNPKTINDILDHSIGRALDLFGISLPDLKRWETPIRREIL